MLGQLRKYSKSVIIYVLFGVIALVFILTFNVQVNWSEIFVCGRGGESKHILARAGRSEIDYNLFTMGLGLTIDPPTNFIDIPELRASHPYFITRFPRLRGDERMFLFVPDPKSVSKMKSRKVMDDLVETYLISEEAISRGLRASPEEVADRIVKDFTDPTSGEFKRKTYEDWVRYGLKTSISQFEDFIKREILREKMIALVVGNVTVSEREARFVAQARKQKRVYEFGDVNPELIAQALKVSDDEAEQFLKTNMEEVKKYVEEHPTETKTEAEYNFHIFRFGAASKSIMAEITDPQAKNAMQSSWKDAKERADKVVKELQGLQGTELVSKFETLAKEGSDHSESRERGGRMEGIKESMIRTIEPAILLSLEKMKVGEISGLIAGDDGYYLVLFDEKKEPKTLPFDEIKVRVAKKIIAQKKAKEEAEKVAKIVLDLALKDQTKPMSQIVQEVNKQFEPETPIKFGETPEISLAPSMDIFDSDWSPKIVPGIGESEELVKELKGLTEEKRVASKVFKVNGSDSLFVVRLKSEQKADEIKPEEIEAVKTEIETQRRIAYYREWYQTLKAQSAAQGKYTEYEAFSALLRDELRALEQGKKEKKRTPSEKEN